MIEIPTGPNVDWSAAIAAIRAEHLRRQTGARVPAPRPLQREEWPPQYDQVHLWRQTQRARFEKEPRLVDAAKEYYKDRSIEFICHWMDVYEPRNAASDKPVWMPFILFDKQRQMINFIDSCVADQQPGLIEKSRTMGATWVAVSWSIHRWLFHPSSAIGWGSQNAPSVDRLGDPKSIFEKLRMSIRRLPDWVRPSNLSGEHLKQFVCLNPDNGSSIVGEVGTSIGRGGRSLVYFKDESAHYEHPDQIEASLSETTNVPLDMSSVSGFGTLFQRKREAGIDWEPGKEIEPGYTRVFVMDWSDHPSYNAEWFRIKKAAATRQGTPHIFAQEIERNYGAAVDNVVIPTEYVQASVDAHKVLGLTDDGPWVAALDVADSGIDRNALLGRKGIVARHLEEWAARDPGVTARKAVNWCGQHVPMAFQYDCVGVGVSVKAETNRLADDKLLPEGLTLIPWNAGDTVLNPFQRSDPRDKKSKLNKDLYENLKAQAWLSVASRFYVTWRAVMQKLGIAIPDDDGTPFTWTPDEIISIPEELPLRHKLMKELSQPTVGYSSRMKMLINKMPDGSMSPNLADAFVMCYFPAVRAIVRRGAFSGPIAVGMGESENQVEAVRTGR